MRKIIVAESLSLKNIQTVCRVRRFALTVHGYSPKAYRFLRETYANILPHEVTMNEWLSKLDVSTGCSAAALAHLTVMS